MTETVLRNINVGVDEETSCFWCRILQLYYRWMEHKRCSPFSVKYDGPLGRSRFHKYICWNGCERDGRFSHRSANSEKLVSMLSEWNIHKGNVQLVLRDNAANMKKATRDAALPSYGCLAHSLQLVVKDGVLVQHSVTY